ncbi:MAG: PRC-barrel domain-containing protein [Clostridia bacterium]|nr:PRC-barrel domain-containing protein [Clostridia bacterium]
MRKITDYLGKPLISICESKISGTIKNVILDENFQYAKWLVVFDENEIVDEKVIALTDIYSVGEHAIMAKNEGCLSPLSNYDNVLKQNNPINKAVYTLLGKELGYIKDVTIDEHNKIIDFVLDDKTSINTKSILSQSDNLIILKDPSIKFRLSTLNTKMPETKESYKNIKVWAMEEFAENEGTMPNENTEEIASENDDITNPPIHMPERKVKAYELEKVLPGKAVASSAFLIGRKVGKNIESSAGIIVVKKGTVITQKIILSAHKNNRLKELAMNSFIEHA